MAKLTCKQEEFIEKYKWYIPLLERMEFEGFITGFKKEAQIPLLDALKEISEGKGRYDMNRLIHASNTIVDMKEIALKAIKQQNRKK